MRLFVASFPDKDCMESLAAAQKELKAHGGAGRFPAKDCFHLTFAFLGPLPSSALPGILEAMKAAAGLAAGKPLPRVEIARIGSLTGDSGGTWVAGAAGNKGLEELALSLRKELASRGFPTDGKRFLPHITLARAYETTEASNASSLKAFEKIDGLSWEVRGISLVESILGQGNVLYNEIAYVRLPERRESNDI